MRGARYAGRTAGSARMGRSMSLHGRQPRALAMVKMTTAAAAVWQEATSVCVCFKKFYSSEASF